MECKYCILQAAILGIFTFARGQHEPFRSLPEDTIALLGSEALLNCSFTSPQPGWVKWSKGTTLVSTHKLVDPLFTGKYKIEGGFEEYNLRIYNISRNDRDSYACFVGDEADNITAKADLYVLENRAECNVEPSYTVVSGDNVTAKCSVDLSEAAPSELAWYQNGVEVSRTPNKANIFTTFLNKTDNGAEFKCQVEHHTLLSTQIVLTSCSMTMDVQYAPSLRVNGSREWYAVEGQSYYAHCDVDANPEGAVFWEDTMHNIIEGEILLINAVARDQRGIYTCYANNSLFNGMVKMNSAYIDLDVQYPPLVEVSAPRFSRQGENVTLNCSVTEANPNTEKITWLKNGVALTVPVVYTIMNITREFTGYYSCTAVNTFHDNTTGSGSHTIYHDVQYPPTLTVVDQNNGTVIEGYDFTSNCSADANPNANITWKYPNGFILHESQLHFDEIHRNRTGTYTCSASNRMYDEELGSAEQIININVQYPPTVTVNMSTEGYVIEGKSYYAHCRVDANPRATVFWEDKLGVITSGEILELRDVQREDHGNYSCFARNSFWNGIDATDYDYIILDVQYPPDVTVSMPTVSKEGENITLMCRVEDANPTTDDVTWIKDGVNLHNPAVYEMTDITRLATGNYTCTAINTLYDGSIGIRNVTYHLNVQYPPSITVNNQNSGKVIQGNTFTASCTADANPQTTITWTYPSGQTVEGSQLTFTEIGRRHTGMYTCKAFNILYDAVNGSAEETIYVDVQSPPSVSVNVSSEWTVIEGSSYYAYCNVDANPLPTVYWEDEMHNIIAGAELKINVVKRDQQGIYTCYANNTLWNGDVGTDSDYIKLDVQYPPLLEVNVPLFSKEGMNVIFNCSVTDANPVPNSITWLRDGVNLNVPAVYEIVNINREFTGYYTCTAVNILHDNTIRSVNYTSYHDVQYPPTLTVLDQNNGTVIEGYDFTSNCSADANPNANITWKYPNGFILHESQLHFDEVHRNRTGTYTCSASNRLYDEELGSAEQIININVQYSPTVTVNASTQWYVVEGNSYYAYCNVDANPYATVYWKHDLSGIIYGERLEIHGVQRQDTGNYTCCARNTFWNDIDATGCNHIILDVQYSPNVTVSMPTVSKEGENITLMCRVEDANPTTDDVIWFKDGVNLHIPTVYEMTDITRLETGNYTCTAINTFYDGSIGIYNVTHHLNVQYLPSVSVTMPEIAKEGSDVTLSCSVEDANPMVENIAWFKNGIDLGVTSLFELIDVPRNASGNYTCSAVNIFYDGSVGSGNVTKYLDIQYPPSVKLSMPEVVKEGDNISMTCLVLDANPMAADITWYKDGVDLHIPGVYTIMDITRDSTGIYTCTATNTFHDGSDGTTSASNYLNVQYLPSVSVTMPEIAKEGSDITLSCSVEDANPMVENIAWFKNGIDLGVTSLFELINVPRNASGNYTCSAVNIFYDGSVGSVNVTKYLDVQYSPTVKLSMPEVGKEGDNISMTCLVLNANPMAADITWYKDGVDLHIPGVYTIMDITRDSTGIYTCTATNTFHDGSDGTTSASNYLNVQYLPSVSVTMPEIAKQGSDITLNCSVEDANPMVENIAWFKNGIDLGVTSLFELINVPRNASGNYTCSAVNIFYDGSVGSVNVTKYLDVQYSPTVKLSMPYVGKEGDNISMTCFVLDANPMTADITWDKDGVDLHIPGVYTIMDITRDSTGIYTCTATNTFHDGSDGSTSASEYLNVQYPGNVSITGPSEPPLRGDVFNITCSISGGVPDPYKMELYRVTVTDGDTVIREDINEHGVIFINVINTASSKLNETYYCKSYITFYDNTELQPESTKLDIQIYYSPLITGEDVTVKHNEDAFLVCTVDSNPSVESVVWKDTNMKSIASDVTTVRDGTLVTSTLTLRDVAKTNEGKYTCIAVSDIFSEHSLVIKLYVSESAPTVSTLSLAVIIGVIVAVVVAVVVIIYVVYSRINKKRKSRSVVITKHGSENRDFSQIEKTAASSDRVDKQHEETSMTTFKLDDN